MEAVEKARRLLDAGRRQSCNKSIYPDHTHKPCSSVSSPNCSLKGHDFQSISLYKRCLVVSVQSPANLIWQKLMITGNIPNLLYLPLGCDSRCRCWKIFGNLLLVLMPLEMNLPVSSISETVMRQYGNNHGKASHGGRFVDYYVGVQSMISPSVSAVDSTESQKSSNASGLDITINQGGACQNFGIVYSARAMKSRLDETRSPSIYSRQT